MSDPTTDGSEPQKLKTRNGMVWTRRDTSQGPLYAAAHVKDCPVWLMETSTVLTAEHGAVPVANGGAQPQRAPRPGAPDAAQVAHNLTSEQPDVVEVQELDTRTLRLTVAPDTLAGWRAWLSRCGADPFRVQHRGQTVSAKGRVSGVVVHLVGYGTGRLYPSAIAARRASQLPPAERRGFMQAFSEGQCAVPAGADVESVWAEMLADPMCPPGAIAGYAEGLAAYRAEVAS